MAFFKDGDYSAENLAAAMAFMRDQKNATALKEQDELLKKIKTDASDAFKTQQNETAKANKYVIEQGRLLSFFSKDRKNAGV